jgi:hypothetical protein
MERQPFVAAGAAALCYFAGCSSSTLPACAPCACHCECLAEKIVASSGVGFAVIVCFAVSLAVNYWLVRAQLKTASALLPAPDQFEEERDSSVAELAQRQLTEIRRRREGSGTSTLVRYGTGQQALFA